ncbi:MAG: DUF1801 domain-containing protein [Gemmatimonadota bacterium]|nr:DUF1801 domain-containing protein [Gemmatimonadota bacterium]
MGRSDAATVEEYLAELDEDRRETIAAVRDVILDYLPEGYEEVMNWGMITYQIPLERYPDTYNGKPLAYVSLASQKNHCSLYLMGVYQDPGERRRLEEAFEEAGAKLDMGKSCLRFGSHEEIPLDALGEIVAGTPPETLIERYEASRA